MVLGVVCGLVITGGGSACKAAVAAVRALKFPDGLGGSRLVVIVYWNGSQAVQANGGYACGAF